MPHRSTVRMPEAGWKPAWLHRAGPLTLTLVAVVIQIPFELRYTFLGLTNLQWTFLILFCLAIPSLVANWKTLLRDRLVAAVLIFITVQWLAALYAPEFHNNALKAAARFTAGFLLLAIARQRTNTRLIF